MKKENKVLILFALLGVLTGLIIIYFSGVFQSIVIPSSSSNLICSYSSGHDLSCATSTGKGTTISNVDSASFYFNPYENLAPMTTIAQLDNLPLTCERSTYTCDRQLIAGYYITKYNGSVISMETNYGSYKGVCDFATRLCTFKTDFSKIPRNADKSYPHLIINSMQITLGKTQSSIQQPSTINQVPNSTIQIIPQIIPDVKCTNIWYYSDSNKQCSVICVPDGYTYAVQGTHYYTSESVCKQSITLPTPIPNQIPKEPVNYWFYALVIVLVSIAIVLIVFIVKSIRK